MRTIGPVSCAGSMGITIDRRAAEDVFQRALRFARSDAEMSEDWVARTDRVATSKNKTFTPALGTALLVKATDRHIDAFSLREEGGHKSYSARSVAKDVFVPCCKVADIDIRTTGAEPLNNQPFLRADRISVAMKVRRGTEADLAFLCECLEEADFLENEEAVIALASFLRARIRAAGELEAVGIDGRPLTNLPRVGRGTGTRQRSNRLRNTPRKRTCAIRGLARHCVGNARAATRHHSVHSRRSSRDAGPSTEARTPPAQRDRGKRGGPARLGRGYDRAAARLIAEGPRPVPPCGA